MKKYSSSNRNTCKLSSKNNQIFSETLKIFKSGEPKDRTLSLPAINLSKMNSIVLSDDQIANLTDDTLRAVEATKVFERALI